MVSFEPFLGQFKRIANSKGELISELCNIVYDIPAPVAAQDKGVEASTMATER